MWPPGAPPRKLGPANHHGMPEGPARQSDAPTPPLIRGLLIIDKPVGPSSMAACARVRAALRRGGAPKRVKVGHGGTLDPLASGVLVILCGKATPMCNRVMAGAKRYEARVDLSAFSTTDDREGERTEVAVPTPPSLDAVCTAAAGFVGETLQRPPAFSAMKVGGQRAYALARKGKAVELEPRRVVIESIDVLAYEWPYVQLDVCCGKGVYIRSLARDLGTALGTGGTLDALRRTAVGSFSIDRATELDALPESLTQADLLPVDVWIDEAG
jgi:tRNA pseudouridine55 synthase